MKKLTFLLAVLLAVTSLNLVAFAQGADKSPNLIPKTTTTQTATKDVAVPANVKPVKSYTAVVGKTYKLPDVVKKTGDTYATSNSAVLTVEKETGRFKAIANGTAYIVTTNSTSTRYIKITVGTGKSATTTSSGKGALAPYASQITILDKTTLAVKCSTVAGQRTFLSKDGKFLGTIPENLYTQIRDDGINKGYFGHDVNERNLWFGEQFNLLRGLSSGGTGALEESTKTDTSNYGNEFIALVNQKRTEQGLPTLSYGSDIQDLANTRARELADNFSHTRPDGTLVSSHEGCYEIIAIRYNPEAAFYAFSNSTTHNDIMLTEKRTTIAPGIYVAPNGNVYWAVLFGN